MVGLAHSACRGVARVAALRPAASRGNRANIIGASTVSQSLILITSVARIPLIIAAIGSRGYGVVLAVISLLPWLLLVVGSLTILARVAISEELGVDDVGGAANTLRLLLRRAAEMGVGLGILSVLLAATVPWSDVLHANAAVSGGALRASILLSGLLAATATPGAVALGVLHAKGRLAVTQAFPGIAALLSLGATAAAAASHLSLLPFVLASASAMCLPFWLAWIWGHGEIRALLRVAIPENASPARRGIKPKDLLVMSGASAPPLYSTGLDPIVLSVASGPAAVAAYGLATRLGLGVSLLSTALYPLYWANFARLRASGDTAALLRSFRREAVALACGTAVLGALFCAAGPAAASLLGHGVSRPVALYVAVAALGVLAAVQTVTLPLLGGRRAAPKIAALVFALIIPNEVASYVLSREVGPSGPIIASIAASLAILGVAAVLIRRDPTILVDAPIAPVPGGVPA